MQDCNGEHLWLEGTAIIRVQVEDLLMAAAVPILNQGLVSIPIPFLLSFAVRLRLREQGYLYNRIS